jgi:Protein of unknown function (DUF3592)
MTPNSQEKPWPAAGSISRGSWQSRNTPVGHLGTPFIFQPGGGIQFTQQGGQPCATPFYVDPRERNVMTIFIVLFFGVLGLTLVFVGLCCLVIAIRRHPRLPSVSGTVVSIEKEFDHAHGTVTFFPVIDYAAPEGNQVRFRSSIGTSRAILAVSDPTVSPWRDGQSIEVFYDADGCLEPCIASPWSFYGWPAAILVGGVLLLATVASELNQISGQ